MIRDRGTKRRTITADLGADVMGRLDEVVAKLNGTRFWSKDTRSSAMRKAVRMYHAYLVLGIVPAPLDGETED